METKLYRVHLFPIVFNFQQTMYVSFGCHQHSLELYLCSLLPFTTILITSTQPWRPLCSPASTDWDGAYPMVG